MFRISSAIAATFLVGGALISPPAGAEPIRMAQALTTCQAWQDQCARRCPQWAPNDPKCVADHCTPKLRECRRTGCWQEGQRFGGALTCNLRR